MNTPQSRAKRTLLRLITALCCTSMTFILAWMALDTDAQSLGMQQRGGSNGNKIMVGEFPPDFELPVLKFGKDPDGKPIGIIHEKETIRLSSFFGKKPVCMIMSSYT